MKANILILLTASAMMLSSCALFQDNTKVTTVGTQSTQTATVAKQDKKQDTKTSKPKKKKAKKSKKAYYVPTSQQSLDAIPLSEDVINGEWTIAEVNAQKIEGEERPYVYFEASTGYFYGSNGCNTLNGQFTLKDGNIVLSNVLSTQKACHNAPYEYQINFALSQIAKVIVVPSGNEYYLNMYDGNGTKILVLRKHNMDYLNGHWQVKKINGKKCTDEKVQLVIDIPELKLHGNTGCNVVNGQLLIDPDKKNSIQFHQLLSTRMACPNQSQEMALLVALEEVEWAKQESEGAKILMFNSKGKEVLELEKIERENN